MTTRLVVDKLGVLFVCVVVVGAGGVLQLGNGLGVPHVLFTANAEGIFAAGFQVVRQDRVVAEGGFVNAQRFFGHFKNADAFNVAGRAQEVFVDQCRAKTDGFKDLRATVRHVGGDTHFGHDLVQAFAHGFDVVLDGGVAVVQSCQGFQRQVGVNGFGAVTGQTGYMVHFAYRAAFHDEAGIGAQAFANEVLMHSRSGQQGGDGDAFGVDLAVGDNQNVVTAAYGVGRVGAQ